MGLHLYCITAADAAPPAGTAGIDRAAIEVVACGDVACWASAHHQPPAALPAAARAHNDVIMRAMAAGPTPVPLRFGQWLADAGAVRDRVTAEAAQWQSLLERFRDRAEYGVRVMAPQAPAGAPVEPHTARDVRTSEPGTGTQYMAALARRQAAATRWRDEAARIVDVMNVRAGPVLVDSRRELPAAADAPCVLAHLVAVSDEREYHARVARVVSDNPTLRFLCTGPWPPYSFVG